MIKNKKITKEQAIARAEEAYRKFSETMEKLTEHQKLIVKKAIKMIEEEQIKKLRKKLNLS